MLCAIDMRPIVEPRSPTRLLRHVKSDGMDNMQTAIGRHCGSSNVAGVLWYLWLPENDVEEGISHAAKSVDALVTDAKSIARQSRKSL